MFDPENVSWLSISTIMLALLLIGASSAAFGRILADLEYQIATGINGVRRIQSRVNLRTHGKRVMLGVFALVVGIMGLTSISLIWQNWISGALFLGVLAAFAVSSLLDWAAERRQMLLLIREREREEEEAGKPGDAAAGGGEAVGTQHTAMTKPEG